MTGRLGGKSRPNDPDAVTSPREKPSEYPSFLRMGYTRPPSAMMVTPDPPVNVVKSAQTAATMTAIPPGIQPKIARKKRTSRSAAALSASTYPAAVSSGMAGNVGDAMSRYTSAETAATGVLSEKNSTSAMPPIATKTGAPNRAAPSTTNVRGQNTCTDVAGTRPRAKADS